MRIIARVVDILPAILEILRRFILDLSANTCQTRHVILRPLTLKVTALVADAGIPSSSSVCVPRLKFV